MTGKRSRRIGPSTRQHSAALRPADRGRRLRRRARLDDEPLHVRTGQLPAYRFGKSLLQIDLNDIDQLRRRVPTVTPEGQEQRISGRPGNARPADPYRRHQRHPQLMWRWRWWPVWPTGPVSVDAARRALKWRDGTPIERHVLLVIGETSDYQTGWCLDTLDGLARDTGYGRSTIGRAVAALVTAGALDAGAPGAATRASTG